MKHLIINSAKFIFCSALLGFFSVAVAKERATSAPAPKKIAIVGMPTIPSKRITSIQEKALQRQDMLRQALQAHRIRATKHYASIMKAPHSRTLKATPVMRNGTKGKTMGKMPAASHTRPVQMHLNTIQKIPTKSLAN